MKRECDKCGMVSDDYWMKSYNHGTRTIWFCAECDRTAQREATMSDMFRQNRLQKIANSKKRKK